MDLVRKLCLDLFAMAGFQVTLYGRFWVTPKDSRCFWALLRRLYPLVSSRYAYTPAGVRCAHRMTGFYTAAQHPESPLGGRTSSAIPTPLNTQLLARVYFALDNVAQLVRVPG
jgi:hypothetical protein